MEIPIFRAKKISDGEWVEGCLIYNFDPCIEINTIKQAFIRQPISIGSTFEVDPNTIGMFSGFLDMSGKKIYQGDFVLTQNKSIREIVYEISAFHVQDKFVNASHPLYYQIVLKKDLILDFEIIGNIHDKE